MADTRAFEQSCDEADKLVLDILVQNMELTLDHVAGKAKEKVGVGTGALRADTRSLGVEIIGDEVHGAVGNSLEHAYLRNDRNCNRFERLCCIWQGASTRATYQRDYATSNHCAS